MPATPPDLHRDGIGNPTLRDQVRFASATFCDLRRVDIPEFQMQDMRAGFAVFVDGAVHDRIKHGLGTS
jgi:hypothetical protein